MGKKLRPLKNIRQTKKNMKGGEVKDGSKFDYDSIKIGKHVKIDDNLMPSPPPTDCNIL